MVTISESDVFDMDVFLNRIIKINELVDIDFEECGVKQQLVSVTLRNAKYGKLIKVPMLYEFYLHQPMEKVKSILHRYLKEKKAVISRTERRRMVRFVVCHACNIKKVLTFSENNLFEEKDDRHFYLISVML